MSQDHFENFRKQAAVPRAPLRVKNTWSHEKIILAKLEQERGGRDGFAFQIQKNPKGEIDLPDNSQTLVWSEHVLNNMRMQELYMFFSEARRITAPGGELLVAVLHPGLNFWQRQTTKIWQWIDNRKPLQLIHYISPEDWEIKTHKQLGANGLVAELMVLTRIV